jgi:uroporphyrinogen decarboxylase
MIELKNDRLLRALMCEPVDITPVWMMRQAGRYLPEYRKVRAEAGDFMALCANPEKACEVTLQPLERYDLDAAILFSDILTIPDAMGLGLFFESGEGPRFHNPVRTEKDINKLSVIDPYKDLSYVVDAVINIRRELNGRVPLIGFAGSPWTLATYMIEGKSSRDFLISKTMMFNQPELMHQLLNILTESVIVYLNAQIKAGAQAIQIFDTWGGMLSFDAYKEFSLRYMKKIVDGLIKENEGRKVPVILFTKGGGQWLDEIVASGCDAISLDWTTHIGSARKSVCDKVCLQGNMDPAILRSNPKRIIEEVKAILLQFGGGTGHVFNLGHGVTPDIKPENVRVFIDAVHELSLVHQNA